MNIASLLLLLGVQGAISFDSETRVIPDLVAKKFTKALKKVEPLSKWLSIEEPVFEKIEKDYKRELPEIIKSVFKDILANFEKQSMNKKNLAMELFSKIEENFRDYQNAKNGGIKPFVKKLVRKLLEALENGERNLDLQMDFAVRFRYIDVVDAIRTKVDENVPLMKDYFNVLKPADHATQNMRNALIHLSDDGWKKMIEHVLNYYTRERRMESQDTLRAIFKDVVQEENTISALHMTMEWIQEGWQNGLEAARSSFRTMIGSYNGVISVYKEEVSEVCKKALKFLEVHKDKLGTTWDQLLETITENFGHF